MKIGRKVARYSRLSSGQLRTKLPAATQAVSLYTVGYFLINLTLSTVSPHTTRIIPKSC